LGENATIPAKYRRTSTKGTMGRDGISSSSTLTIKFPLPIVTL
jgi:hypothetical protein